MVRILFILLACFQPFSTFAGALRDLVEDPGVEHIIEHNAKHGRNDPYTYQLVVAALFQDEADYLKEWIEYHKLLGAEHFYLYNNLSTDHYLEVLQPYIDAEEVELFDWPEEATSLAIYIPMQVRIYQDAFAKIKGKAKWMAVIDIDEFLVPVQDDNLIDFLKRFESDPHIGGVCGAWVAFGTSHIERLPQDKLMIEVLVLNGDGVTDFFPWGRGQYKSIIRPDCVENVISAHYAAYKKGYSHVGLPYELIQINHYWTRDEYFLRTVKIPRREIWGTPPEVTQAWADGMNFDTPYGIPILRFVPALRKQMGLP